MTLLRIIVPLQRAPATKKSDPHHLQLARRAIDRILQQSELKDLWDEAAGPDRDVWFKGMDRLSSRLK